MKSPTIIRELVFTEIPLNSSILDIALAVAAEATVIKFDIIKMILRCLNM